MSRAHSRNAPLTRPEPIVQTHESAGRKAVPGTAALAEATLTRPTAH